MYIYIQTDINTWSVGFYNPADEFIPETDWTTKEDAAKRVHYLNGGN